MSKNPNISNLDTDQMARRSYDEENDATRVIMVGNIGRYPTPEAETLKPQIVYVDKPFVVKEIEIREVEKPVTLIEEKIVFVDKPVMVKEIEYVDRYIVVKEVEVREIERPVIVQSLRDLPSWIKLALVTQVLSVLLMVAYNLSR